jgi:zinc transporter ZupT
MFWFWLLRYLVVPAAAIGVMATVSGVELWWHSAVAQHDFLGITAAVAAGAVLFAVLDPLLPKHEDDHHDDKPSGAAAAAADLQGTDLQVCFPVQC